MRVVKSRVYFNPAPPRSMGTTRHVLRYKHRNMTIAAGQLLNESGHPFLCLERSIGERFGADRTLWETGAFDAQVYPDLPFASNWSELLNKTLDTLRSDKQTPSLAASPTAIDPSQSALIVRTVGAQIASRQALQRKMQFACQRGPAGGNADALLFVSGSHPARALPFAQPFLQSSFSMLRDASAMRQSGVIPHSVSLWAVENPVSPPERLLRKVEAGAEVVITQPPFVRSSAELWFEKAQNSGVLQQAKLIAGIPMASSIGNLNFWLGLCGLGGTPEARQVANAFPSPNGLSPEAYQQAVQEWNKEFILWVSEE